MAEALLRCEEVSFHYDDLLALDRVSFTVDRGEKVALLGSNGCGKSTLLRVLAILYKPSSGAIYLEGEKIKKSDRRIRQKIGILFQNPDSMIFNPTVFDEIAFSLKEFGFDEVEERVLDIAKRFEIEHLLEKSPLKLSGGEKQKVMLAAILVYEPEVLLLDEPTSAMDPKTTGWFLDLMMDLDLTTILATHDIAHAYEFSDRALIMDERHRLIYDGDMEEATKDLDLLLQANLIHKHRHRHKNFLHSHYHLHF